jgi:hypothetical protein
MLLLLARQTLGMRIALRTMVYQAAPTMTFTVPQPTQLPFFPIKSIQLQAKINGKKQYNYNQTMCC